MNRKEFKVQDRPFVGFDGDHEITVVSHTDDEVSVSVSKTRYSEITLLRFQIVDGKIVKVEDNESPDNPATMAMPVTLSAGPSGEPRATV